MATKIKLMRLGKMRAPYYRIVVADARTKRDGRSIETIGKYHPKEDPSFIEVDSARVQYWLGVGAQPTEAVAAILRVTGDWQQFKGLPAPPPMLVAPPRSDKHARFEEAAKAAAGMIDAPATTPRKKPAPRVEPESPEAAAAEPVTETPAEIPAGTPAGTPADTPEPLAVAEAAPAVDDSAAPAGADEPAAETP